MELVEPGVDGEGADPRDFAFSYASPHQRAWQRGLITTIERVSGARRFERMYRQWAAEPDTGETIFEAGLRALDIDLVCDGLPAARVPKDGPLLIIANHPYGVVDGLALAHLSTTLRPDTKLMTHSLLCRPPEAKPYLLPVDFGADTRARATTLATCRRALTWLETGHCHAIFPSGSVATAQSPWRGPVLEPAWHPFLGKLAKVPNLTVVPVFIHGRNSRLFQLASHITYALRVALLFRESARMRGGALRMTIGEPVGPGEIAAMGQGEGLVMALRRRCYALAGPGGPPAEPEFRWPRHIRWN